VAIDWPAFKTTDLRVAVPLKQPLPLNLVHLNLVLPDQDPLR
jgi:hypothetical protein